jgi:galactokinase
MSRAIAPAERAAAGFRAAWGKAPDLIAYAPGRVNLIGEHTDYNDGYVLPCAIPFGTAVALGRNDSEALAAVALDLGGETEHFSIHGKISAREPGHWANHLRGVARGLTALGLPICGANLAIAGDVPQRAGLSSSASLGIALGLGLATLAGAPDSDRTRLARVAQWAEHRFVGCECGLMDQLASAHGVANHALLIDCRSAACTPVAMPRDATIFIVHSGVQRGLVESEYNTRRAQCMAAAAHYGVPSLRDLDAAQLARGAAGLDPTAFCRARHVVSENARTLAMAEALARADYPAMAALMTASHASMRDDFEITLPAIDALVAVMADALDGQGGARMTGGGFGGCVVAVCPQGRREKLEAALSDHWSRLGQVSSLQAMVVPAQGARIV